MNNLNILLSNPLFADMSEQEIRQILQCLGAITKHYAKGQNIYCLGDSVNAIGIVLSGRVHILKHDVWGNAHLIHGVESGGFFAEAYACCKDGQCEVEVEAAENSEILFINTDKILRTCSSCCLFHQELIKNLLQVMAEKNIGLIEKIELITPKSIRERILAYFSQVCPPGKDSFEIPFDRQQLANYLSVDRSALSAELSKMQKAGLIEYHKNQFTLRRISK